MCHSLINYCMQVQVHHDYDDQIKTAVRVVELLESALVVVQCQRPGHLDLV